MAKSIEGTIAPRKAKEVAAPVAAEVRLNVPSVLLALSATGWHQMRPRLGGNAFGVTRDDAGLPLAPAGQRMKEAPRETNAYQREEPQH